MCRPGGKSGWRAVAQGRGDDTQQRQRQLPFGPPVFSRRRARGRISPREGRPVGDGAPRPCCRPSCASLAIATRWIERRDQAAGRGARHQVHLDARPSSTWITPGCGQSHGAAAAAHAGPRGRLGAGLAWHWGRSAGGGSALDGGLPVWRGAGLRHRYASSSAAQARASLRRQHGNRKSSGIEKAGAMTGGNCHGM